MPIKFVVEDPTTGNFVSDETVEVLIADETGSVRVNASPKSTPPVRIDQVNRLYQLDWETNDRVEGTYVLSIYFQGASVAHMPIFLS